THLRVGGEISYDIDFIVTTESRHRVQQVVPQVTDNNIHQGRKFSGELEGVHLDIYIPHESQLGMRLQLKVEALSRYVDREIAPLVKEGVDPDVALGILAEATAGTPEAIPGYVDEMFILIPRLSPLSKVDQKLVSAWRRAWVQAALRYASSGPLAPRQLL